MFFIRKILLQQKSTQQMKIAQSNFCFIEMITFTFDHSFAPRPCSCNTKRVSETYVKKPLHRVTRGETVTLLNLFPHIPLSSSHDNKQFLFLIRIVCTNFNYLRDFLRKKLRFFKVLAFCYLVIALCWVSLQVYELQISRAKL